MAFDASSAVANEPVAPAPFDPSSVVTTDIPVEHHELGPDWNNLYAGLDGLDQRVKPEQAKAFQALDNSPDGAAEARARAINKTFYEAKLGSIPQGAITGSWPTVRKTIARHLLGQPGDVPDTQLYSLTADHLQGEEFVKALMMESASPTDTVNGFRHNFPNHFLQESAESKPIVEAAMKPFVPLPEAPKNLPNMPELGLMNPALSAGVWNSFLKPTAEGVESPFGVATLGTGSVLRGAAKAGIPLAKHLLTGFEGAFAALMGKQAYDASPEMLKVINDPNTSFQSKVEAVGSVVGPGAFALLGALGALQTARGVGMPKLKGEPKVDTEILTDDALKAKGDEGVASASAAQEMQNLTPPPQSKASVFQPEIKGSGLDKESTTLNDLIGQPVRYEGYSGKLIRDAEGNFVVLKEAVEKGKPNTFEVANTGKEPLMKANEAGVIPELGWRSPERYVTVDPFASNIFDEAPHFAPEVENAAVETTARTGGQPLGVISPGFQGVQQILANGTRMVKQAMSDLRADPKYEGFTKLLNEWVGDRQLSAMRTQAEVKALMKRVPDKGIREGISNWIEAEGDMTKLTDWRDKTTKLGEKTGYEAALNLSPDQIAIATEIRDWFNKKFSEAEAAGVIDPAAFRENYVTHIVDQPLLGSFTGASSGALKKSFKYAKERVFPNFFELEQAGFKAKTKDFAHIMAVYDNELAKSIGTRNLIRNLLTETSKGGEPLAIPLTGRLKEGEGTGPNFISDPASKSPKESETIYRAIDNPALRKWAWLATDAEGKQTMIEGELGLHPEIRSHLENALGRSEISKWMESDGGSAMAILKAGAKLLDSSNAFVKRSMLGGISMFHAVHEGKRAAGYRVNPLSLEPIDPNSAFTQKAVKTGLMIAGDNDAVNMFAEGLGARGGITEAIPIVRDISRAAAEFTFHTFIPRLKMKTWTALYERNLSTYAEKIKAGTVTPDDVAYLTSHQVNARFGHLNYADLGRDPTLQHFLRIAALAPDFFESNMRNYGQAAKGFTGADSGKQAAIGFSLTAATLWLTARVLNKSLDDDPHFEEPFSVISGGRRYTMRNEAEDLWRMMKETPAYAKGRLSPGVASAVDALTQTNWRGEKITPVDAMKEFATKIVPISARWIPAVKNLLEMTATGHGRTVQPFEEFLGSQGLQVSRHSPLNAAYKLASEWRHAEGQKEDTGVYPVSKYQQLRYALEDGDTERAHEELQKLVASGEPLGKVIQGFRTSIDHPYTGSQANDYRFKASLSREDRAKVDAADKERDRIKRQFYQLVAGSGQ